jgi:hypothetical protein
VLTDFSTVPLLIINALGIRRLPPTTTEDLLELIIRRCEQASTILTSRPVEDWGKLLHDSAAATALLDRIQHHAHVITCGPRGGRTNLHPTPYTPGGPPTHPADTRQPCWPDMRCRSVAGSKVTTESSLMCAPTPAKPRMLLGSWSDLATRTEGEPLTLCP